MEKAEYLIDSNVIIDFLGDNIPSSGMNFVKKIISEIPHLSIISKIEILGFNSTLENQKKLNSFFSDSIILPLDESIADLTIKIRKKNKINLPDAIIAATAIENNLKLITRNLKDFKKIENLKCINPFEIK